MPSRRAPGYRHKIPPIALEPFIPLWLVGQAAPPYLVVQIRIAYDATVYRVVQSQGVYIVLEAAYTVTQAYE